MYKSLNNWKDIKAPKVILDIIEFGYKLPLLTDPPARTFKNNKSALQEQMFVEDALFSLLKINCISELCEPPEIINPLSVSKQKSGKKRLILDLRHVNNHLYKSNLSVKISKRVNWARRFHVFL